MSIYVFIKGENINLELDNNEVVSYDFNYKVLNSSYSKGDDETIDIKLCINISKLLDKNKEGLKILEKWSNEEFENNSFYKQLKIIIFYKSEILRKIEMPYVYIKFYREKLNTESFTKNDLYNETSGEIVEIVLSEKIDKREEASIL